MDDPDVGRRLTFTVLIRGHGGDAAFHGNGCSEGVLARHAGIQAKLSSSGIRSTVKFRAAASARGDGEVMNVGSVQGHMRIG